MLTGKLAHHFAIAGAQYKNPGHLRLKRADNNSSVQQMHSEERKRIGIVPHQNRSNTLRGLKIRRHLLHGRQVGGARMIIRFGHDDIALSETAV